MHVEIHLFALHRTKQAHGEYTPAVPLHRSLPTLYPRQTPCDQRLRLSKCIKTRACMRVFYCFQETLYLAKLCTVVCFVFSLSSARGRSAECSSISIVCDRGRPGFQCVAAKPGKRDCGTYSRTFALGGQKLSCCLSVWREQMSSITDLIFYDTRIELVRGEILRSLSD
jgi:hypothetical protein